ncbi:TPA: hypothetical protein KOT60_003902, partial [Clostridioides difficile]|nr:hypothetical protein [Clostridioides difficile]
YRKRKRENEKIKSLEKEFQSDKFHIDEYSIGYLEEAIMKLSEKHRDVLLLKLQHELNDKEISQILDIKPENVRKRLSRAREELKYIFIKDVGV